MNFQLTLAVIIRQLYWYVCQPVSQLLRDGSTLEQESKTAPKPRTCPLKNVT